MFTKVKELKIKHLSLEMNHLLYEQKREELLGDLEDVPNQNYSFLEKFFKRKEYHEYLSSQEELYEKINHIEDLSMTSMACKKDLKQKLFSFFYDRKLKQEKQKMLEDKLQKLLSEKEELNHTKTKRDEQLREIYNQYEQVMNSRNLSDLSIDFKTALQFLHKENQPIFLEKADDIENPQKNYTGLQDFILVHRTDRMPTDNRLKSIAEDEKDSIRYPFNGRLYEFPCEYKKNSLQYTMNHELQAGSWKDCEYTVMIPFSDVPKELIGGVSPGNSYTMGGVNLTKNCYVLCPKGKAEELRRNNPKLALYNILEWESKDLEGASHILMKLLGYRVEEPENTIAYDSWKDKEAQETMKVVMEQNGFEYKGYTKKAMQEENALRGINAMVAIYVGIKDNGLVTCLDDVNPIFRQLNFSPYSKEQLKYVDLLFSKLEIADITLEPEKKDFIQNLVMQDASSLESWLCEPSNCEACPDLVDFTKNSLGKHKEETNNVLEHVLTDVIHKSVLDEIANCKLKEIDLTS